MDDKTFATVVKVLADKVSMLEWQLERAEEEAAKLRAVNKELAAGLLELESEQRTHALNMAMEDEARNEVGI